MSGNGWAAGNDELAWITILTTIIYVGMLVFFFYAQQAELLMATQLMVYP